MERKRKKWEWYKIKLPVAQIIPIRIRKCIFHPWPRVLGKRVSSERERRSFTVRSRTLGEEKGEGLEFVAGS